MIKSFWVKFKCKKTYECFREEHFVIFLNTSQLTWEAWLYCNWMSRIKKIVFLSLRIPSGLIVHWEGNDSNVIGHSREVWIFYSAKISFLNRWRLRFVHTLLLNKWDNRDETNTIQRSGFHLQGPLQASKYSPTVLQKGTGKVSVSVWKHTLFCVCTWNSGGTFIY